MSLDHLIGSACIGDQACTNLVQLLHEAAARIELIAHGAQEHVVCSLRLLGTSDATDVLMVARSPRRYELKKHDGVSRAFTDSI